MLSLLAPLNTAHYTYRTYVVGSGDEFSARRAHEFERGLAERREEGGSAGLGGGGSAGVVGKGEMTESSKKKIGKEKNKKGYSIHTVPRARQIHQSLLTSPLSSLSCLCACLKLLCTHHEGYPDLILTNGPATSLILILASTILRYFSFLPLVGPSAGSSGGRSSSSSSSGIGAGKMRVVYVESWARVKRPSLSGRIIVWCGLCDRVLVQWKGLQDRGWGEYKGVLVR